MTDQSSEKRKISKICPNLPQQFLLIVPQIGEETNLCYNILEAKSNKTKSVIQLFYLKKFCICGFIMFKRTLVAESLKVKFDLFCLHLIISSKFKYTY